MNVDAELRKFSSYMLGERKSPNTIKQYTFLARLFLDFTNKPLEKSIPEDIEKYKHYLASKKKYSKTSQYLAIKAVRHLYKFKELQPPINLTVPKRPKKMPVYLNEKETEKLIESTTGNLKAQLIVSLLAYTGIRVSELCNLKLNDIDLDENILNIYSGKGDRDRIVIMPKECTTLISTYLEERYKHNGKSQNLIISQKGGRYDTSAIEKIVKSYAKEAGITKNVTPHVLRHTFATAILRNGGDIRFIQQLLGHASVATTQIYTHVDDNTLKEMYNKFRPKY